MTKLLLHRTGQIALVTLGMMTTPSVHGALINYAIFGQQGVTLGGSTVTGVVASNGDISVTGFSNLGGLQGGGSLIADNLGGINVSGDVTFNGSITTGQYSNFGGNVNSGGSVDIGVGAKVGGSITATGDVVEEVAAKSTGNITVGGNFTNSPLGVAAGNVAAGGSVTANGTIAGNVNYGTTVSVGPYGAIQGMAVQRATTATPTAYVPISTPNAAPFTAGTVNVSGGGFTPTVLAPGSYGALSINLFGELTLTAGNYYFSRFDFAGTNINFVNLGPNSHVNIFVTGDITETIFARVTVNGQRYENADSSLAADVVFETLGNVTLEGDGSFFGTIFAQGDVTFNKSETMTGQIIAGGHVYTPGGVGLTYVPADALPIPEPSALALTAIGVAVTLGGTRLSRRPA